MPRRRVDGNFEIARGYARSRTGSARGLTVLTGHSGITLVKVVPVLARVESKRSTSSAEANCGR